KMLANPKFGSVGLISYLYFLFYELLSPFIEVFGVFTMVAAFFLDLLNLPFILLFMLIYAFYNSVLTLTAFFSRIHTIDLTVHWKDCVKAIMLCFFEVTTLRFIMAFVRLTAFKGYKKKKLDWGRIERKKMQV
ncbi:MAG: glycosyltransferase family 2 protein, partial [Clostridia bacterium]|nr:glycosyltransferase family 2 protein [Clostridia bacterium]